MLASLVLEKNCLLQFVTVLQRLCPDQIIKVCNNPDPLQNPLPPLPPHPTDKPSNTLHPSTLQPIHFSSIFYFKKKLL